MADSPVADSADPGSSEHHLVAQRLQKLQALHAQGVAYPNDFRRDHLAAILQRTYGQASQEALAHQGLSVCIAGRVMRRGGPFVGVQDVSGTIQFYLPKALQKLSQDWQMLDIGDIVGVSGQLHKSGKGELYVEVTDVQQLRLLSKALRPLPDKFHGLADQELKYRQRYVDLIINERTRDTFRIRSQIIRQIRHFFEQREFVEVETPMLQVIPGGASAEPFITHHNALGMDMYLRIAPELYLKRLVVGGMERVFEINRNFRNEGVSTRTHPEFTMLEFYQAYADYHELMDTTESLLQHLAQTVMGTTELEYQGQQYDLAQPFKRISLFDAILAYNADIDAQQLADLPQAKQIAERLGLVVQPHWGLGKIQMELFEATVEQQLHQPVFITDYPAEVSPLARRNDSRPEVTDRFEFFLGGREVANGFSELNDPIDQAQRFRHQVAQLDAGDNEAMFYDEDYIRALEYGMPPTAGEGIGIDRLVMFFANMPTIKDVILFPHMRPVTSEPAVD